MNINKCIYYIILDEFEIKAYNLYNNKFERAFN